MSTLLFDPGQFLSFTAQIEGNEITRAYSIASPPAGNRFALCLNRVEDGRFSPYLFDLPLGGAVSFKGPLGTFTWRNPVSDSILVATGTGIAPFRSMLHWMLPRNPDNRITLIFGVRYEEHLLYREEFGALASEYPNFDFRPTLTRPEAGWKGRSGRVQSHAMEAAEGRTNIDVYICGMREMVDDVRAQFKARGLDRRRIIYERYD